MIITKQLQVLIDSSLAQGRDYEDIRSILLKQGFQEADISDLFAQYRGAVGSLQQKNTEQPTSDNTDLGLMKVATPAPTPKDQLFNKNFVHPEVKPGFVPVGFENENTPQSDVKDEVKTFMNVGTNTQTAANMVAQEQSISSEQKEKLPAPGTVPLPSEMKNVAQQNIPVEPENPVSSEVPDTTATPGNFIQSFVKRDPSQKYINVGFGGMPEMEKVLAEEQAKKIEKSPWPLVFALLFLIACMGAFFYWFFILNKDSGEVLESERLLRELQSQNTQQESAPTTTTPTGPVDPFTGEVIVN